MEIDINENKPHKVFEAICVDCKRRWIAVCMVGTSLNKLQCPYCKKIGFVINTGEELDEVAPVETE